MININYRDPRPIYEQIKDGLKRLMLADIIKKDEKLPSVRDLAGQMSINPNTIQRAYRELESEGYIYSVTGRGSFASGIKELDAKRRNELSEKLQAVVRELYHMGVSENEIIVIVSNVCNDCAHSFTGKEELS